MSVRVAEVSDWGGPEVMRIAEYVDPVPEAGEVVVAVRGATINPTDLVTRSGARRDRFPDLKPPFVPGWDLAGEVSVVGSGAEEWSVGDRVAGMIPGGPFSGRMGAYASAVAVESSWLAPVPDGVSLEEAATVPLNSLTARHGLDILALPAGSRLLITGASGAVGGFATQLAVAEGLHVVGTAGRDDEEWLASLGAAEILPRDADLSQIDQVDGVFDAVPLGPAAATPALREGGTAVFTRHPDPPESERNIRFEVFLAHADEAALRSLMARFAAGELRTRVARVMPLEEVAEAHRLVEGGGLRGKVVLTP